MVDNTLKPSRRQVLALAGAGAVSLAMPRIARAQSGETITLLHGAGAVLVGWAPSFVAEDMGFYKDEGLFVERIYNGSGPAALTALISGAGVASISGPGELLVAASRRQDLRVLFGYADYQAVHFTISKEYAAKHGISADMTYDQKMQAAKTFHGIRAGISTPGSLTDLTVRTALKAAGIDAANDARIVPLGSVANALAAMSNGNIDGFVGATPAPETARAQIGAVILFSNGKGELPGLEKMAGPACQARGSDVKDNPDIYKALVRADVRGLKLIIEDPATAGALLYKNRFSNLAPNVWKAAWEDNLSQFKSPYVTKESLAAWIEMGAVPSVSNPAAVNLDKVIDMTFVDEAVRALNWQIPA